MDNSGDDSEYSLKAYSVNNQQGYGSSSRSKVPDHSSVYSRASSQFVGNEEDVEDEELEEKGGVRGVKVISKDNYDDDDDDDDDVEDDADNNEDDDENDIDDGGNVGIRRPPKKRKLKSLISNYEFAPRVPAPPAHQTVPPRPPCGVGRNLGVDWTDHETFALLDAWGDQFLKLGRKSLRSEEWQELAEKLSQETNVKRSETQCRNKLVALKKKYKKEKMSLVAAGGRGTSKWTFYRKMDMLMYSSLSCGIDSGEYVFMNPKVYLNCANGFDEMRDSPANSKASRDEEDDSDRLLPKGKRSKGKRIDGSSFRLLADSIEKFSEVYEKIEINKRKQMVELENMRMDFQRQIELQRRQILEKAQAEITKIREGDEDDNDVSTENLSG